MKRMCSLFLTILFLFGAAGCVPVDEEESSSSSLLSSSESVSSQPELSPAEKILTEMTLEEKVGQLFLLAYRKDENGNNLTSLNQAALDQLTTLQPGGVILFEENVSTVEGIRGYIKAAQNTAKYPLFVSVDQEGGAVQRITKSEAIPATAVPPMFNVGKTGDVSLAQKVGIVLGSELSVFGFNLDFAPDCDVFSNPNNTVIGHRSFSTDPQVVAEMSVALAKGLEQTSIIPVAKHFPGHGDTSADTHVGYAISNKTLDELWQTELVPFQAQVKAGVPAIMVAHISLPVINGDNTPASLSKAVVTELLRGELGYDGVVITDALAMGAIVQNYGTETAAVQAVLAGCDVLLIPQDAAAAYNAVLAAVKNGTIPQARIDESVLRILNLKQEYGLFEEKPLSDPSLLGSEEHLAIVSEIAAKQP